MTARTLRLRPALTALAGGGLCALLATSSGALAQTATSTSDSSTTAPMGTAMPMGTPMPMATGMPMGTSMPMATSGTTSGAGASATVGTAAAATTTGTGANAAMTPMALPTAAAASVPHPSVQTESDLRTALSNLFQEHTYLAGQTSGALVGGRMDEARASAVGLDTNSQEIANLVGAVYGQDAQAAFLVLWRRHIADYAQYAQAVVAGDQAAQAQSRQDLNQFAQDVDTFLSGANPNIAAGSLAPSLAMHVNGTLDVIDAQAARDYTRAFTLAKQGANMTAALADPLSTAIAQQFPDQFPTASAASASQ